MDLDQMSEAGLTYKEDITISSMCTVFAESEVVSLIAQNKETDDIVHGLNKAVASKTAALAKRVGGEERYMMTGGVSKNKGLVKTLEELGIGRPSTYAPTITTIINRRYVAKENKNLYMTELGEVVNNIMVQAFPSIVDVNFTANMESLLDKVEEGVVNWKTVVSNFYPDLDEAVLNAEKELAKVKI